MKLVSNRRIFFVTSPIVLPSTPYPVKDFFQEFFGQLAYRQDENAALNYWKLAYNTLFGLHAKESLLKNKWEVRMEDSFDLLIELAAEINACSLSSKTMRQCKQQILKYYEPGARHPGVEIQDDFKTVIKRKIKLRSTRKAWAPPGTASKDGNIVYRHCWYCHWSKHSPSSPVYY